MDRWRLETFSDGVLAVAITLLALDLRVAGPGHGSLARQLVDHWPSFAAYIVSFFTIGTIWVNHHTLLKNLSEVDRTLLFLNLLLLFFVVAIPFATTTTAAYLSHGGWNASLAAAILEGVFEGISVCFGLLFWWSIRHQYTTAALTHASTRRTMVHFGVGTIGYVAAIGVAFVNAPASLLIAAVVAGYYVFEYTPQRGQGPSASQGRETGTHDA